MKNPESCFIEESTIFHIHNAYRCGIILLCAICNTLSEVMYTHTQSLAMSLQQFSLNEVIFE